ncbi:MAG TPA: flap endonuclease-1 [Vicinamibacterales bacterium]|nr:flap endonuclease-1 [Vicinamibacterales bacterium]
MGVVLTPILQPKPLGLGDLRGRTLAIDGNGELYQFLALLRLRDGTPLSDARGRVTSHLSGLFFRTTRLIADYGVKPVFVFDGAPPALKAAEIARRRASKLEFERQRDEALARGDTAAAYAKATMTSRLTREMVQEARELLRLLGIPVVQAPSEGEAQAAHMARRGSVWAAASKDYDTLLFGAPRLLRFLTISGKEFLPSRGAFRPLTPELLTLDEELTRLGISRQGLVDLAILVGTDFNDGVHGVGPKKALGLVKQHGSIDAMPQTIRDSVGGVDDVAAIRRLYLEPDVTDEYAIEFRGHDADGIVRFLCEERQFGETRVRDALARAFPSNFTDRLF